MRFIIIQNNLGEEIWINIRQIAAITPSRTHDDKCSIVLNNGLSYNTTSTPDEIYKVLVSEGKDLGLDVGFHRAHG